MARFPEWFPRLDAIADVIRQTPLDSFGRREIATLFSCSDRDSIRLLHKFGASHSADALSLPRSSLLTQLEIIRSGAPYASFLRKRHQVAQTLAVAQAETVARNRRIAGSAEFQIGKTLKDLPAGIRIQPGRIICDFQHPDEFWALVDQLADIAAQDPNAFEDATTNRNPA
jgi:hypothetical protein